MDKTQNLCEASKQLFDQGLVVSASEDIVFKTLLKDPTCRDYLIDLIVGITDLSKEKVQHLTIENSEHTLEHIGEKQMVSDMIVSITNHVLILEMNQSYYPGLIERNRDYGIVASHQYMKRGSKYSDRKKVYVINFDHFQKYGEDIIVEFAMRDFSGKIIESESYKSYHINLVKLEEKYYNGDELTEFEKKLLILKINELKELEKISEDDLHMKQAKDKLVELTTNEEFIGLYDLELHRKMEAEAKEDYAKKQGYESGMNEGFENGSKETKEEIVRKMKAKGLDLSLISEITGLSLEQIEKL